MRDDPIVAKIMQTGYGFDAKWPVCPVCGCECETVYKDKYGDIFGCNECVEEKDAWNEDVCMGEEE